MAERDDDMKIAIQQVVQGMMDRTLHNVMVKSKFDVVDYQRKNPFYAALLPDEILKGSHFERRFVTAFGKAWEQLALVIAKFRLGTAMTDYRVNGLIQSERLQRISETLSNLEHKGQGKNRVRPNWQQELQYVLAGRGDVQEIIVICDVFIRNEETKRNYAFELKAPLPNSDITKVSKEKILKLLAMQPTEVEGAYFVLPYNPYGMRRDYKWAPPFRWFDMVNDQAVLIGEDFWDFIGGVGTYQILIEAINEIGTHYKTRISKEFLGIVSDDDSSE